MQFDLEKATPFSVAAEEFIALLQDPKRFMIASGGTEEDSIKYDETQDVYEGEKFGQIIPLRADNAKGVC